MTDAPAKTRADRRKARTRAALVAAAQTFLAEGTTNVSVQKVADAADVGLGSFYNHFTSKDELFEAALHDALEQLGAFLDAAGGQHDDPAEVFAASFRLLGRAHRGQRELSRLLLRQGHRLATADVGLAPRVRRDLLAARDAGRFAFDDLEVAMVVVTGAAVELGRLLLDEPGAQEEERDDATTTDAVTTSVLLALGLDADDARRLATAPL